jgi:cell division protein FtsX
VWVVFLALTILGAAIGGVVSTLSVRKYLQAV